MFLYLVNRAYKTLNVDFKSWVTISKKKLKISQSPHQKTQGCIRRSTTTPANNNPRRKRQSLIAIRLRTPVCHKQYCFNTDMHQEHTSMTSRPNIKIGLGKGLTVIMLYCSCCSVCYQHIGELKCYLKV